MANLNFTKQGDLYKAEVTATADFNLHLEMTASSKIEINGSTVENGTKECWYSEKVGNVFDHDFDCLVYPKYVEIVSTSPVESGIISFAS